MKRRKGITHTKTEPMWMKDWRAFKKSVKQQAMNLLAVIGFVTVVVLAFRFFAGGG